MTRTIDRMAEIQQQLASLSILNDRFPSAHYLEQIESLRVALKALLLVSRAEQLDRVQSERKRKAEREAEQIKQREEAQARRETRQDSEWIKNHKPWREWGKSTEDTTPVVEISLVDDAPQAESVKLADEISRRARTIEALSPWGHLNPRYGSRRYEGFRGHYK